MLGPRFPLLSFESIYNFRRKAEVHPKPEPQPLPSQCEFLATHRVLPCASGQDALGYSGGGDLVTRLSPTLVTP